MILHRIPGPHGFNLMPIMFCYGCEGLVVPVWATWLDVDRVPRDLLVLSK